MRKIAIRSLAVVAVSLAIGACAKNPTIFIPPPVTHMYVSQFDGGHTGNIQQYALPLSSASTPSLTFTPTLGDADGMAVDSQNHIYVAFPNELEIQVFAAPLTSTSAPLFTIGPIAGGFFTNTVAFDHQGNLWVASEGNGQIFEFNPPFSAASTPSFTINGAGTTPVLQHPEQIAFDAGGDMAVEDFGAVSQVLFFQAPLGGTSTPHAAAVIATGASPVGVGFDVKQQLYVSTLASGTQVFAPPFATGNAPKFTIAAPAGASNAFMLSFDSSGNLYVPFSSPGTGLLAVYNPPFSGASPVAFTITNGMNSPNIAVFAP
ncbi:MAG: hypothetical protein JO347_05010 [Candidatus Eremiobacteraeota bacterium]|nr:hypothetical protein [Candidatus Eremiobacteraeota bacterium]MBV8281407.1 hypothetical protein [Candidatus Eremiobacteraeota bacterium]